MDGHGAESEEPRNPQDILDYVYHRNALRRAETVLALGSLPSPGRGATGYQGAKGKDTAKGKSKGNKGQKRSWDDANRGAGTQTWAAQGAWWAAAASTWPGGNGEATTPKADPADGWSCVIPVLLIFFAGAVLGGVIGYLVGYIKHKIAILIPRPPRPPHSERETIAPRNREPPLPTTISITKREAASTMSADAAARYEARRRAPTKR